MNKTITILKEVKPNKKAKVKMTIIKNREEIKEAPNHSISLIKANSWTVLGLNYGNSSYEVETVYFYNKDGIVYKLRHLRSSHDICQIIFDKEVKLKQKPKFDGSVFFIRTGKCSIFGVKTAVLYVPMEYLESIGYRVEKEVWESGYKRNTSVYLRTDYFEQHLESEIEEINFIQRIDDLIALIQKAKSADELPKALEVTFDIYNASYRKPFSFGNKPRGAK